MNRFSVDFPILQRMVNGDQRIVYLDSAATSLTPVSVVDAMSNYHLTVRANTHRGEHLLADESSSLYEDARRCVAQFLGCRASELAFVRNSTEAINIIAQGLPLRASDTVLVGADSHHSNLLPWQRRARVETVRVDEAGGFDVEHFERLLELSPTVVALTHCSNVSGAYLPIHRLASMARRAGAIVVVDASQSLPHRRIDFDASGFDFLVFSGHKMLGPTGIGGLCGRACLLDALEPLMLGGGMVEWVETSSVRFRGGPHRHEAGTPNIAGAIGLATAVEYLLQIGDDTLAQHDLRLGELLLRRARDRSYIEVIEPGPAFEHGAILSFRVAGIARLGEIARTLSDSFGIMCRSGKLCAQPFVDSHSTGTEVLRASGYLYNDEEDVEYLFQSLDRILTGGRASRPFNEVSGGWAFE